jgi:L-alanine-DL-glutamate epimerase-like enolase superfamily enzyme
MSIAEVEVIPLIGGTVDGGWPQGHEPQENLHTLLIVRSDDGLLGYGSCFTSVPLVAGAMQLLWPLLKGQSSVEPERVWKTLRTGATGTEHPWHRGTRA